MHGGNHYAEMTFLFMGCTVVPRSQGNGAASTPHAFRRLDSGEGWNLGLLAKY